MKAQSGPKSRSSQNQAKTSGSAKLSDVFFVFRFGILENQRHDILLTSCIFGLVILSRLVAFPGSIWEQDEAYLAIGVQQFEPGLNHPHPPWFPLWLLVGKAVSSFGVKPAESLQLVSAFLSAWMIFPLTALWSALVGKRMALCAASLFLFLPGSWLLAGRAFTGTAATAFLVAALAVWLGGGPKGCAKRSFLGGLLAAASILVRPHFLPVVAVIVLIQVIQTGRRSLPGLAALVGVGAIGLSGLLIAAGGPSSLIVSMRRHSEYHFSRLPDATLDWATFGLSRYLGSQSFAVFWVVLTLIGMWAAIRSRRDQRSLSLHISAALVVSVLVILAMANPQHARYFVPIVALSTGFVLYSLVFLGRSFVLASVSIAILISGFYVLPDTFEYRSENSPAISAVRDAVRTALDQNLILVADRTLVSFLDLVKSESSGFPPLIYGYQILNGSAPPPPPDHSIAIYDNNNNEFIAEEPNADQFSCDLPAVRMLGQDRFMDLVIVRSPVFKGWVKQSKPYIIIGN